MIFHLQVSLSSLSCARYKGQPSALAPGLALKNPPKKTHPKKPQKNHLKKPTKNVFFVGFFKFLIFLNF
jgi:hypothetical protein